MLSLWLLLVIFLLITQTEKISQLSYPHCKLSNYYVTKILRCWGHLIPILPYVFAFFSSLFLFFSFLLTYHILIFFIMLSHFYHFDPFISSTPVFIQIIYKGIPIFLCKLTVVDQTNYKLAVNTHNHKNFFILIVCCD